MGLKKFSGVLNRVDIPVRNLNMHIGNVTNSTKFKGRNTGEECADNTIKLLVRASATDQDLEYMAIHKVAKDCYDSNLTKATQIALYALPVVDVLQTAAKGGKNLTSKMQAGAKHAAGWTMFIGLAKGINKVSNKLSNKINNSDRMQNFEENHPKLATATKFIGGNTLYIATLLAAAGAAFKVPEFVTEKVGKLLSKITPKDVTKNAKNRSESVAKHINSSKVAEFTNKASKKLINILDKPATKIGITLGIGALITKMITDPFRLSGQIKKEHNILLNKRANAQDQLSQKFQALSEIIDTDDTDIDETNQE